MQIEKKKILYHGTAISHDMIDLNKGGDFKDFGRGYYLTSSLQQANDWATKRVAEVWSLLKSVGFMRIQSNRFQKHSRFASCWNIMLNG